MNHRGTASDALQEVVGDFGRWQAGISLLMALLKLPISWFQLNIIVLEAQSDYWCSPPSHLKNLTVEEWRNLSHPTLPNGGYDSCRIYDLNYTAHLGEVPDRSATIPCHNWQYKRDVFTETIVSEWDLVCNRAMMTDVAQATLMSGVLIGNVVFGMAADRIGRKIPLIIAIGIQAITGILCSFSPWFIGFLVARFLMAVATGGTMIISFVLVMEIVGDKWRTPIAILYQIPFSLGICIMSGLSYLQRDWRDFHFTLSAISALFLLYWWLVPESPRWLLAVGRYKEAVNILEDAARKNGLDVTAVKKVVRNNAPEQQSLTNKGTSDRKATVADLMKTPNLRRNSIALFLSWFLAGLIFFGFSQALGKVGSNIFVTMVLAGLIAIPGTVACIYVMKYGRRKTIFISHCMTGAMCLLLIAFPKGTYPGDWPRMLISGVAISGMSITFPALYVFSGELFPTVVRNVGLGSASMFSRLGSVLAPFVKSLDVYGQMWPPLVFGFASIIGAVLVAFLPETKDCRLPDTLEDGEKFGKSLLSILLQTNVLSTRKVLKTERMAIIFKYPNIQCYTNNQKDVYGQMWPPLVFGFASIIGAVLVAFLPETKDCRLPDTLEDGEKFGKKSAQDRENGNYIQVSQHPLSQE
ncbi:hypothetical protein C0J52_04084 [Blattella germanica]|nr:hypothetical protein C0J52_04084 [Blattella germanica]